MKGLFHCLLVCLLMWAPAHAQFGEYVRAGNSWRRIDRLVAGEALEKAMPLIRRKLDRATRSGDTMEQLKAQLYLLHMYEDTEDADSTMIALVEGYIKRAEFPYRNIWQSVAAQLYWNYYADNKDELLERSPVADSGALDFRYWDAAQVQHRAAALFLASVRQTDSLQQISVGSFDPVLLKGRGTRHLRPTLFDLLAFRAVGFFENDEKDLQQPAFQFVIDDPAVFAGAAEFVNHDFQNADSGSLQYRALQLYQEILRFHLRDTRPDALLDADLQRLAFAFTHSVLIDKDGRYIAALQAIEKAYPANPFGAIAAYEASLQMMHAVLRDEHREAASKQKADLRCIKARLDEVIARFPQGDGTESAKSLQDNLTRPTLDIRTEAAIIPEQPSKLLVSYKNVPRAWFRVVRIRYDRHSNDADYNDSNLKQLLALTPALTFAADLPGTADLREHTAEVMIAPLPPGTYAIIASAKEDFAIDENALHLAFCQSSRLAVISLRGSGDGTTAGFVLDRKTGTPISGVRITGISRRWNDSSLCYVYKESAPQFSRADGSFSAPSGAKEYESMTFSQGADFLFEEDRYYAARNPDAPAEKEHDFYFTDRSLYRPGQTIFFKGIVLKSASDRRSHKTVAGRELEVTLYGANGQRIASQKLRTNDWGSVSGQFKAPETGLNGNMRIEGLSGRAQFSVEAYKRPKFKVEWDSLIRDYALHDTVTVSGKAVAYAGNSIEGAAVNYRVVRTTSWQNAYASRLFPHDEYDKEQEIRQGVAVTDASGRFSIRFPALPDRSIDPRSLPVFNYEVAADITDLNGETQSGSVELSLGYRSLQIRAEIPDRASPADLDTLYVRTENLAGRAVPAKLQLRIARLQQPDLVYRKRYWPVPDQFTMTEAGFRAAFPLDPYKNEDDPVSWPEAETVLEQSFRTSDAGRLIIPQVTFRRAGRYVISLRTTDKAGLAVEEQRSVDVYDSGLPGTVYGALTAIPGTQELQPGDTARITLTSGLPGLRLMQLREDAEEPAIDSLELRGADHVLSEPVVETGRGGHSFSFAGIYENRLYLARADVRVPWLNKALDISWETHRDKLEPGQRERWTMNIRGHRGERLAAELAATLYDASLDALRPHSWNAPRLFPDFNRSSYWSSGSSFGTGRSVQLREVSEYAVFPAPQYYDLLLATYEEWDIRTYREGSALLFSAPGSKMRVEMKAGDAAGIEPGILDEALASINRKPRLMYNFSCPKFGPDEREKSTGVPVRASELKLRKNLQETAFFMPQLRADSTGAVTFSFTIPEALSEWRLIALAHTKDLRTGTFTGTVKTQKPLMVQPGLPRFLRQGDAMTIAARITNISATAMSGTASLEILNAETLEPLAIPFGLAKSSTAFKTGAGGSAGVSWHITVPEHHTQPVIVRIRATSGRFTDGEENILPVLSNRTLITETLPIWINGHGEKTFSFEKLKQSTSGGTLRQHALTVEYTANPAWLAIQALPYLMEFPHECAEQTFNRYFATALAAKILSEAPRVKAMLDHWEEADTAGLITALNANEELKSALLEETPWVLEAADEKAGMHRLASLLNAARLAASKEQTLRQLEAMQLPDGGWPWFSGNTRADRHITQYILAGIGRLRQLGIIDKTLDKLAGNALRYADRSLEAGYQQVLRSGLKAGYAAPDYDAIQYLYMRSFFSQPAEEVKDATINYYRREAEQHWRSLSPYGKGLVAIAFDRSGKGGIAKRILQSLRETAVRKDEMGMYWPESGRCWRWWEAPVETQALLIEAFTEAGTDVTDIEKMKRWLLRQKQTQRWPTTKATADACYALLLLGGRQWLHVEPKLTISLGNKLIRSGNQSTDAGTGYLKTRIPGAEIRPEMGSVRLELQAPRVVAMDLATPRDESETPSWGAVYWQYFENTDKIAAAATPLQIRKTLYIQRNTERGPVLEAVGGQLKTGDKVVVRLEISVDREMEYLHLKDGRAACMEPVAALSGYRWKGGLGYYESTKDASANFFFDRLPKGKHVLEYPVFITGSGDYSNGLATIQCMYAPEFSAHSAGGRLQVK